ncbi:MAG: hypothetical protein JSW09_02370 [Pseudomonadota bacterium]|nr:MAG: hypothetical protein JSW09_02370 [Pseudomonadota bacterium]
MSPPPSSLNTPISARELITRLHRDCLCVSLDAARLRMALESEWQAHGMYESIVASRPNLFAPTTVYITAQQAERMHAIVRAVETLSDNAAYAAHAFARAPVGSAQRPGAHGAFLGFDFHLDDDGPKLIEINTNPGGALLNVILRAAQQACCREAQALAIDISPIEKIEQSFLDMFATEWRAQRGTQPLRTIAIVDAHPHEQYLYPEFQLYAHLFARAGWQTIICDPGDLRVNTGRVMHADVEIDLIYNRLTDFYLQAEAHQVLRTAYLADQVVLTPNPHAYALYADKRNLPIFSDAEQLAAWGLPSDVIDTLQAGVPKARHVDPVHADSLWQERGGLFFKPAIGYGSRAAYRGDKLTRRVFAEILKGEYIAQAIAPPSERHVRVGEQAVALKLDIRCLAYRGEAQLMSARLYQGQTTNFRTPGGGFAPVFTVRDPDHLPSAVPAA